MSVMDDGEVDHSSYRLLTNPDLSSCERFDELLRNATTCTHTHTCHHTHTQVFAAGEGDQGGGKELKKPIRKSLGNKDAVRKYREKKKAHAAYLEEEVKKLRFVNQQLLKRLQGQAALEAEILRLRSLLVDLQAKIDVELGVKCLPNFQNE